MPLEYVSLLEFCSKRFLILVSRAFTTILWKRVLTAKKSSNKFEYSFGKRNKLLFTFFAKQVLLKSAQKVFSNSFIFLLQSDWMLSKKFCRNFFIFGKLICFFYSPEENGRFCQHKPIERMQCVGLAALRAKQTKRRRGPTTMESKWQSSLLVPVQTWAKFAKVEVVPSCTSYANFSFAG